MFFYTKDTIQRILQAPGGLPEEFGGIDYKRAHKLDSDAKKKIKGEVVAFLNCLQTFGQDKFIIFGIQEEKKEKKKIYAGLGDVEFPEDNEWQNLFSHIGPRHPAVETGVIEYQGNKFGYFRILADNYHGPYYCSNSKTDCYWIRRGSAKCEMTPEEKDEFRKRAEEIIQKGAVFPKTRESLVLSVIGQYLEANANDCALIEAETGETFEEFQRRCLWPEPDLVQREKSRYVGRVLASVVDRKQERLLQFSSDDVAWAMKIIRHVLEDRETWYSDELLDGVVDTLAFFSANGFSHFTREVFHSAVTIELLRDSRYRARISQIAESAPDLMLSLLQSNQEALADCRGTFCEALQTIAWFPEHYAEAIELFLEWKKTDPLYRLLRLEAKATAADFQQKLQAVRKIADQDPELAFEILRQALYYSPSGIMVFEGGHVPQKYLRLYEGPQHLEIGKLQTYYSELLDLVGENVERVLKLLPQWLAPFPYSNLNWLADLIEQLEPRLKAPGDREKIWDRLCNSPLEYASGQPVEEELNRRLTEIGRRFRPDDPFEACRTWFRADRYQKLGVEDFNRGILYEQVAEKQNHVLRELYGQGGISQVIAFLSTIPDQFVQSLNLLAALDTPLSIEDDKALLNAFLDAPRKYEDYFYEKSHTEGVKWLELLGIEALSPEQRVEFFAALEPSVENLRFFEDQMGEDVKLYWAAVQPRALGGCLQVAFEQFMNYDLPEKAFELFQHPRQLEQLPPEWLYQRLLLLRGEYAQISMPGDVFARAYQALSGRLKDECLEDLENLSFERYRDKLFACGAQDLRPQVTFRKIANSPEFFLDCVKGASEFMSFAWQLLTQCDAVPDQLQSWLEGIRALCASEPEDIQVKAEYWAGYILYNKWNAEENGGGLLDTYTAELLERSEQKRKGFFAHAWRSSKGVHVNGEFEDDARDRACAKYFANLAESQKNQGNTKLSECLAAYAKELIAAVEQPY